MQTTPSGGIKVALRPEGLKILHTKDSRKHCYFSAADITVEFH
ncbi:hypothetical protein N6H18_08975 [Reichenbachiella agarivorans]|uniref:Uncharacterized protein n=1 Tax=Reichenbachiella agarivorans TaxID=2979464 RepID=A0ABY6CVN9_9BACT|nr:hypothetical protein [Reichenbachiella agarivorans]UXP34075.1 hypothetical protein N6H18_08975 [Reichenbachiella agarivorans]